MNSTQPHFHEFTIEVQSILSRFATHSNQYSGQWLSPEKTLSLCYTLSQYKTCAVLGNAVVGLGGGEWFQAVLGARTNFS